MNAFKKLLAVAALGGAAVAIAAQNTRTAPAAAPLDALNAPDFSNIDTWHNFAPLKMAGLRGKVVLVDFWTYTCLTSSPP